MSRDPRINPMPGDRLRISGEIITVQPFEGLKPATIYFSRRGQLWTCGIFRWPEFAAGSDIIREVQP
ncbi:hypothetical protein [Dongia deserti]|uniref:hypothetical protein n=1 Tax=Dongia deserti TaxID=2268030 RepID=UPI000E656EA9|nr:hypothetical protein [Dongia deserti]